MLMTFHIDLLIAAVLPRAAPETHPNPVQASKRKYNLIWSYAKILIYIQSVIVAGGVVER